VPKLITWGPKFKDWQLGCEEIVVPKKVKKFDPAMGDCVDVY
jgi:hypothetical protein